MDFADNTFNDDPNLLAMKGVYIFTHNKSASSYQKAYQLFENALSLDPENENALYYLGLMNMLGYGRE